MTRPRDETKFAIRTLLDKFTAMVKEQSKRMGKKEFWGALTADARSLIESALLADRILVYLPAPAEY